MALVACGIGLAGCGSHGTAGSTHDRSVVPTRIGVGKRYELPAASGAARRGTSLGPLLSCQRVAPPATTRTHLELFAEGRAVLVPAHIGAPGRCTYHVFTLDASGVLHVDGSRTMGDAFDVWGQPLSRVRWAHFVGRVRVYVNGRRRSGNPRAVPLHDGDNVVVEVGPYVPPHPRYRFPPDG